MLFWCTSSFTQALQTHTKLAEDDIDNIIDEADRDNDGNIDYHEFCLMMRQM
jgi:Ca2+-binding EF-hand superfamily protein